MFGSFSLRRGFPHLPRGYQIPYGEAVALLATGGATLTIFAFLLPASPFALKWPLEGGMLLVWAVCGLVLWLGGRRYRDAISERTRQRELLQRDLFLSAEAGGPET